jgi:hypothetical protein
VIMQLIMAVNLLAGTTSTVIGVEQEAKIALEEAANYGLNEDQTELMLALRRCENGGPGNETGIFSELPDHPAHRFKNDPKQSVRLQFKYTAGTIKKRYKGDLTTFLKRWNPKGWEQELKNIQSRITASKMNP